MACEHSMFAVHRVQTGCATEAAKFRVQTLEKYKVRGPSPPEGEEGVRDRAPSMALMRLNDDT